MKCFPVILLRMGGLPMELLEPMNWKSDWLKKIQNQQVVFDETLDELYRVLATLQQTESDYQYKAYLSNLRKSVAQKKIPNASKLQKLASHASGEKLTQQFQELSLLRIQQKETKEKFAEAYQSQVEFQLQKLLNLSFENNLLCGLALSSHSFYYRLRSLQQKAVVDFRKKEWQTIRSLWKYLSRMVYKTSPFSSFTTLAIHRMEGKSNQSEEPLILEKQVRLNHLIYGYLQELLSHYRPFYQQLPIQLNDSLLTDERYTFLLNTRNVESIQQLEKDEVLEWIIHQLADREQSPSFASIIPILQHEIQAETAELEAYLFQLIQVGLLEWKWPVSGMAASWAKAFLAQLAAAPKDVLLEELEEVLQQLLDGEQQLKRGEVEQRISIQQSACTQLQEFWDRYKNILPAQNPVFEAGKTFQRLTSKDFVFKAENVFFEDSKVNASIQLDEGFIKKTCSTLQDLMTCLAPLQEDQLGFDLLQFYKASYPAGAQPSLLEFYHAFHSSKKVVDYQEFKAERRGVRLIWKKALTTLISTENNHLDLDLEQIQTLYQQLHPNGKNESKGRNSVGAMLQYFEQEGEPHLYVDTCFTGFGKMTGRFLSLFPKELTQEFQEWNLEMQGEELWIENSDASFFNANVHPSLLPFEIRMPGSQNNLPVSQQISVADLRLQLNEETGDLDLFYTKTKQPVFIFDFGFEALANRSPLYRFLAHFCKPPFSYHPLRELINEIFQTEKQDEIIAHPRISLHQKIILQRQRWYFSLNHLPQSKKGESDSNYFIRLNNWRETHQLPKSVFYSLNPKDIDLTNVSDEQKQQIKKDDYKPRYLNFQDPLGVRFFAAELKRVPLYLKIEEMLPNAKQGLKLRDGTYVSEMVVQWEV